MKRKILTTLFALLLMIGMLMLSACNTPDDPNDENQDDKLSAKLEDLDISGDDSLKLLPTIVEAEKFEEFLLKPLIEKYQEKLLEYDPDLQPLEYDFFAEGAEWLDANYYISDGDAYLPPISEASGLINDSALKGYLDQTGEKIINEAYYDRYEGCDELNELNSGIYNLVCGTAYKLCDPEYWIDIYTNSDDNYRKDSALKVLADEKIGIFNNYPITGKMEGGTPVAGKPIYVIVNDSTKTDDVIDFERTNPAQALRLCQLLMKYTAYEPKSLPNETLDYRLINNGTAYEVCGIGTVFNSNIVIESTYNNLPVIKIG